jgi:DNA-binding response OmpR family regulator
MHLLIVEDEDAIRSALVRGLARPGRTIASAASLAEARLRAAEARPDLLISDLTLPDGRGLEVAAELAVPCVFMTGFGTFEDAVAAMRLGALEFFTKPVSIKALRQVVDRCASHLRDGPLVVDSPQPTIRLVRASGLTTLRVARAQWAHGDEARAAFALLQPHTVTPETRQVLAECLQAVPAGRAVINTSDDRWTLLIDAALPATWPVAVQQVISDGALTATFGPERALIECRHG